MKIVTGHQPVYLPWLGLFHKISLADAYVFMDDVQYLHQDWNNRNKIKGTQGEFYLTVPVKRKASPSKLLKDMLIDSDGWGGKKHWQTGHWRSLQMCYGSTPYWNDYAAFFEDFYTQKPWKWLAEVNERMLHYFLDTLGLKIEFIQASTYGFEGHKSDLVLDHCQKLKGNACVLGTHGKDYLEESDFLQQGIFLYYQDYHHPTYPQRFGEFISHLSVVDLLFNCGPDSIFILLSGNISKRELVHVIEQQEQASVISF